MGKRIANLGPQTSFVVQEGILNYRGDNTIAISLWALDSGAADLKIPTFTLESSGVYLGGPGNVGKLPVPTWKDLRG